MIWGVGVGGVVAAEGVAVAGVLHDTSMTLVAVGMLALVVEAAMMLRAVASLEIPLPSLG